MRAALGLRELMSVPKSPPVTVSALYMCMFFVRLELCVTLGTGSLRVSGDWMGEEGGQAGKVEWGLSSTEYKLFFNYTFCIIRGLIQ